MLIKGAFVSGMSGSVGGVTASHGRSGAYFRARVPPVNPNTIYQQAVRTIQANLASAWVNELSEVQRDAWDVYGSQVATTNRVGDTIYLTGLNWFIAMNLPRMQCGLLRESDAPTVFALASLTLPTWEVDEAGQESSLTYTNTDAWAIAVGGYLRIAMSRPQNPSVKYFKGPYRYLDFEPGAVIPPTSPLVSAVNFPVVEGQRVFAMVRASTPDGRISAEVRLNTLVIA